MKLLLFIVASIVLFSCTKEQSGKCYICTTTDSTTVRDRNTNELIGEPVVNVTSKDTCNTADINIYVIEVVGTHSSVNITGTEKTTISNRTVCQ